MKKFLVILMVLAMASVLLVGCVPTPTPTNVGPVFTSTPGTTATVGTVYSYTPTATDADADTVTFTVAGITGMTISTAGVITWTPTTAQIGVHTAVVTASDGTNATAQTVAITVSAAVTPAVSSAPVLTDVQTSAAVAIFDVLGTGTLYMNKVELGASILVKGTGPSGSAIKLYIGDVVISGAVGETEKTGLWTVAVAKSSLGADEVKKLTAKCTEVGLAESVASNSVTFTLDTTAPSATTLAATAETAASGGTCVETGTAVLTETVVTAANIETGTWVVDILGGNAALNNVKITDPDGVATTYTAVLDGAIFAVDAPIPGVTFTLVATIAAGQRSTIVCVAQVAKIADRATVLFSEDVTSASALAITNTWTNLTTTAVPTATTVAYNSKTLYFTPFAVANLARYDSLRALINGAVDLAGNIQTTASVITCTVGKASATSLAP